MVNTSSTYTSGLVVLALKIRKPPGTVIVWWHATARGAWTQEEVVGVQAHLGYGRTLASSARHRLAPVGSWLGLGHVLSGVLPM